MNITELQEILKINNINLTGRALAEILGMNERSLSNKKKAGTAVQHKLLKILEEKFNIVLTNPVLDNTDFPTMGERIKYIRQALGYSSQEEFAIYLSATKQYVNLVENNKSKLSIENLTKLMADHNVSANYILAGIGHPFLPKWE